MPFDDDIGTAFTALAVPVSEPLAQPVVEPTTLFGGGAPAVQFAPVTPVHFGLATPLHGPEFKPVYEAGTVHAHTHAAEVHAVVGHGIDVRG